jgi:glycosyltransferase involved in cell wall biosynthesis
MKIVMLTPDCYMIDRRILLEAKSLIKAGHQVTLLAGFETAKEEHFEQDGIKIHRYVYDWDDERLKKIREKLFYNEKLQLFVNRAYMFLAKRFLEISPFEQFMISKALEFEADVYHVHDLPCLKAGYYAAKIKNVPLIYDAHELYYAQKVLPARLQKSYFLLEKKYIRYPNVVITVNPFIARLMAERYQINEPQVILNCTEIPNNFDPQTAKSKLRKKGKIPNDYKVVLYQGWISPERNLETLIKSVKYFPEHTCLAIIGYGDYEVTLRQIAEQEGLAEKIFFFGQIPSEEMLNYSAGADLGVIPYQPIDDNHLYCSPNKLFEYILAGVPIITDNLPFFNIINEKYDVIEITDLSSAEKLGKLVSHLFDNSIRLDNMKQNCLNASKELNWDVEGKKLLTMYNKLKN